MHRKNDALTVGRRIKHRVERLGGDATPDRGGREACVTSQCARRLRHVLDRGATTRRALTGPHGGCASSGAAPAEACPALPPAVRLSEAVDLHTNERGSRGRSEL